MGQFRATRQPQMVGPVTLPAGVKKPNPSGGCRHLPVPFHSCASSQGVWQSPRSLRAEVADTTDPSCVADRVVVLEPPLKSIACRDIALRRGIAENSLSQGRSTNPVQRQILVRPRALSKMQHLLHFCRLSVECRSGFRPSSPCSHSWCAGPRARGARRDDR